MATETDALMGTLQVGIIKERFILHIQAKKYGTC